MLSTKPVLYTERLSLRPFQIGDVGEALTYRNDSEFARYLPHIPHPFTPADAEAFVRQNMTEPWDRSPTFAVVFFGRLVGTVNLEVDAAAQSAMLGYAIGRAWWGKGIATEAAQAVMAWGTDTFKLSRIWASTDVRHLKSQRVMAKLGMKRESLLEGHHKGRDGESIDEVVYAIEFRSDAGL